MRRLLVSCAIVVIFGGVASAADMAVKAPPVPVQTDDWSGWFVGANAGYSWGQTNVKYTVGPNPASFGDPPFGNGGQLSAGLSSAAAVGGGQFAYNFEMQQWVFGIVADFDYRNGSGQQTTLLNKLGGGLGDRVAFSTQQNWIGTVRGRVGYAPTNTWLLYVSGGLAYGRVSHSVMQGDAVNPTTLVANTLSDSGTRVGGAAGAGVEYALNRLWSIGVEYLFVDLGTDTLTAAPVVIQARQFPSTTAAFRDQSNIVRFNVNYKFE